jgi:hypothetical protein
VTLLLVGLGVLGALVFSFSGFAPTQFMVTRREYSWPAPPFSIVWNLAGTASRLRRCWVSGLRITSGWRPAELNALVGGHPRSRHQAGRAVDVAGPPADVQACVDKARDAGFTEVLHYPEKGYAHLGWGEPHGEVA